MSERTRSKLAKLNNKNHNNHNNNQNNNTNVNKPGKPKRKQVYKSNNNNVNNNDNNNNAIEPINVEEEPIWEIHSEIFAQIYRPVVTRATVLRMYHMAKPLFRRKNLISGYLRANSLQPPKERKKSKEFSLEKFCTKRLNVVSREPKIIELENVEIKIPDLHNKKLQVLVTCYEVKHRRKKDEKTGRLRPWALEFTKLPQEQWSQTNDFGVKFGPILVDTSAIHCAPYLISTNYCVVFQAITYPANDKRLQNVKIKAKDKVELPYNAQYSSLEFVHEDIIDMSTRQMCDLYSEYLDLIEDGKLMPDAEYRLGTNVFPNMDQEPVDTVFKMKSYKAKGAEVIADNDANMIFEHVQVPPKRPYKAKRYFTEEPKYYEKEELIPKLRSLAHILPIEYQFRYSIKTGISDVFTDRVKVETRQNFKCPICLMNWHQLQPLLLHLVTTHLELEITWEKRIKHTQINISVDKRAVSVFGLPYTLPTGQSEFYKFNRLRYPQYELLNNNLEVVYAKKKKNKEKRKVVLSSDGRAQKYRSQTLEPIPTHQLDYDSEDEENIDRSWMKEDNEKRINDFADFYPDERKFLIMWNNYVIDHPIRADRDVKHTCKKFATDLRTELQDENLYHLFMMYLHHMWELKLLSADDIIECAENVHQIGLG